MKHRISKAFYSQLPEPIAAHIRAWAAEHSVRFVSVDRRTKVYVMEDARYTAFSADCSAQKTADAAGEWSGAVGLRPTAECPIPPGCTLIESGHFCGKAYLHVYHNDAMPEAGRIHGKPRASLAA